MGKLKLSTSQKFKKNLNIFFVIVSLAFIVLMFSLKNKLNETITRISYEHAPLTNDTILRKSIIEKYNYSSSGSSFEVSFLEFGAEGCVACRKMEKVMDMVVDKYPDQVKVEFINMLTDSGRVMGSYFGVFAIPCQVLLDKNGNEFFRHTGYLAFPELQSKLFSYGKEEKNY